MHVVKYLQLNIYIHLLILLDTVFGPATSSKAVYDMAASPVVKAAMDGITGMFLVCKFFFLEINFLPSNPDSLLKHSYKH